MDVRSPAMIEARVGKAACPLCEGSLRVLEHRVYLHEGESLREVLARCSRCGTARAIFFRIVPARPN